MPTLLIPPRSIEGDYFLIEGDEAHHLLRVLRKKPGDEIDITDGKGTLYHGALLFCDPGVPQAKGRILSSKMIDRPRCRVRLFQGLPKGAKFDYVLEKATELGVESIHPFLSEKNLIKKAEGGTGGKMKRWKNLIEAATKQCGRSRIPELYPVVDFNGMIGELKASVSIVLSPAALKGSFQTEIRRNLQAEAVNLVIGPESGFSEGETEALVKAGAKLVSLGDRILRTETAGLVGLSILNYELDLF